MKKSKVLKTLSFKVRYQTVFISDQSKSAKLLFTRSILSFFSPFKLFIDPFSFCKKPCYLHDIQRKHMLIKSFTNRKLVTKNVTKYFVKQSKQKQSFCYSCQGGLQAQDYRILALRSYNLFSRRQIKYKMIRPLLDLKRESITMVCKDLLLPVYPDKSNNLLQYSRNRIRKQIIPSIKYFINPQVENSLFKTAELLKKEQSLICSLLKNSSKNVYLK